MCVYHPMINYLILAVKFRNLNLIQLFIFSLYFLDLLFECCLHDCTLLLASAKWATLLFLTPISFKTYLGNFLFWNYLKLSENYYCEIIQRIPSNSLRLHSCEQLTTFHLHTCTQLSLEQHRVSGVLTVV